MKTVAISNTFNKLAFKVKKHSPEILVVAGVVGIVTSTVTACRATIKAGKVLENTKKQLDLIHEANDVMPHEDYSEQDYKKDITITYAQTVTEFAKLYGPSIILGTMSIGCILTSNTILRKRNAALAAAYTAVFTDYKGYRRRVVERFGKELDRELKFNLQTENVEETITDKNGKEKKIKKTVETVDETALHSEYSKFFDSSCYNYEKDPEYNLLFLKNQESYANDLLKAKGYLYLNTVYKALGLPETKAGQVVGWIYNPDTPVGDNYVDFGIHQVQNKRSVNGYEPVYLLDFNVDGNIWEMM